MALTLIVLSDFYEPTRHTIRYVETLARAVRGPAIAVPQEAVAPARFRAVAHHPADPGLPV